MAQAAVDSGVATRPIADMKAYRQRLSQFVYQSGSSMQPLFAAAKQSPKRVVYAEGEDERVLRAAQVVVDEGLARPLLLGRPEVIAGASRSSACALRGQDCDAVDLLDPAVYGDAAEAYYQLRAATASRARWRRPGDAQPRHAARRRCCVRQGAADAMLCGTFGRYADHLRQCAT